MQTPLSLPLRRRPVLSLGLPSLRRSAAPRPLDLAEAYGATDAELPDKPAPPSWSAFARKRGW